MCVRACVLVGAFSVCMRVCMCMCVRVCVCVRLCELTRCEAFLVSKEGPLKQGGVGAVE